MVNLSLIFLPLLSPLSGIFFIDVRKSSKTNHQKSSYHHCNGLTHYKQINSKHNTHARLRCHLHKVKYCLGKLIRILLHASLEDCNILVQMKGIWLFHIRFQQICGNSSLNSIGEPIDRILFNDNVNILNDINGNNTSCKHGKKILIFLKGKK